SRAGGRGFAAGYPAPPLGSTTRPCLLRPLPRPGAMHAEVVGTRGAGPPLVYVPGIDGSGELLLGTAARLERRFRLTRLRYAGDPGGGYADLAHSVAARIAELGRGPALVL